MSARDLGHEHRSERHLLSDFESLWSVPTDRCWPSWGEGVFNIFFSSVVLITRRPVYENMSGAAMNDAVLAGVPRLLDDLMKLLETHDHADILFLVGREETAFYAHRLVLNAR